MELDNFSYWHDFLSESLKRASTAVITCVRKNDYLILRSHKKIRHINFDHLPQVGMKIAITYMAPVSGTT